MDCFKGSNESHIYWNSDTKSPPNQQIYRSNGLLKQLESLEANMIHMSHIQLKEIEEVSDIVKNTKKELVAEIDSTRDQFLLQLGDIVNSICNLRQVEDKRYKKEKEYLESIFKKVKKSDKKHGSYENQTMDALSQLLISVNEVLLHQGETDEYLENIIDQLNKLDANQISFETQTVSSHAHIISQLEEIQTLQGEVIKLFEKINRSIIKLLTTLPTGKKVSSVSVMGNQIDLHSFINFDAKENTATFQRIDGSLVVVDSRQIVAITFPSNLS